jgi:hypothetical protein
MIKFSLSFICSKIWIANLSAASYETYIKKPLPVGGGGKYPSWLMSLRRYLLRHICYSLLQFFAFMWLLKQHELHFVVRQLPRSDFIYFMVQMNRRVNTALYFLVGIFIWVTILFDIRDIPIGASGYHLCSKIYNPFSLILAFYKQKWNNSDHL